MDSPAHRGGSGSAADPLATADAHGAQQRAWGDTPLRHETRACDGTACHFAGGDRLRARLGADLIPVRCLGHCHGAPVFLSGGRVFARPLDMDLDGWLDGWGETGEPHEDLTPVRRISLAAVPVALRHLVHGAAEVESERWRLPDGPAVLAHVESAAARAVPGAPLPDATRWRAARDTAAPMRFVVANGLRSDPGAFAERVLLEEDPHAVLEGMVACARAIDARRGFVCIRAEYPRAQSALRAAVEEARAQGHLGGGFDVEVVSGSGAYVDGEDNALLNALEGIRGEPGIRLLEPERHGLFDHPTIVESVETLAVLPWVVRTGRAPATRLVSLSGAVRTPGLVEVPLGTPLATVIERGGGGMAAGRRAGMALVGGPTGHLLPAARLGTPLGPGSLPRLGQAGVVVLDDTVSPRALATHLFEFVATESCGGCAPCRNASSRLAAARDRVALEMLLDAMESGSVCRVGRQAPGPIRDLLAAYGDAVLAGRTQ